MTAFEVGRAAWPQLQLRAERFEQFLASRRQDGVELHAADLYLACACLERVAGALEAFDRLHLTRLPQLLAKLRPTPAFIDEVGQLLRAKLFVGDPAKLSEYSGRGPLLSWLRVVAVRTAIDLKRTRGEDAHLDVNELDIPVDQQTPELAALRSRYQPLFREAFRSAFATLSSDERNLVKLHYVDQLSMEELAKLNKVNRSTIFRRLHGCMAKLQETVRDHLTAELGISPQEFDSLANAVRSDLELSLSELLRPPR